VILGDITFRDFEIPPTIQFGGSQRIAIHRLGGGGRVIDALGNDDADIEFSGALFGTDAIERASQLAALCSSGRVIPLAWDAYYFLVVVKEFSADYKSDRWIPYRLSCVISPPGKPVDSSVLPSVADAIIEDLKQAASLFLSGRLKYVDIATTLAQAGIPARNSQAHLAAVSALSELDGQIGVRLIAAEQDGTASNRLGFDLVSPAVDRLGLMVGSTRAMAILTTARAYTRRALARLISGRQ